MSNLSIVPSPSHPARMKLEPYSAELRFSSLTPGIDNIHFDVYLSPRFVEVARRYLLDLLRQAASLGQFYGLDSKCLRTPETAVFRKALGELLQAAVTRAQYEKNIEMDLLCHVALLEFFAQEINDQFSTLVVECKDWIRSRGEVFEHSEQAHVKRAQIAELQANRKNIHRRVGQTLFHILKELDETVLAKARRALFGEDYSEKYELLGNRLLFVEGGNDDYLFLEKYALLGNFISDPDRFENFDALLLDFVRDFVLADSSGEELRKARKTHERLVEQALAQRAELARIEEEEQELLGRMTGGEELFPWLWKRRGSGAGESKTELVELKRRQSILERRLAELAPQLEAAKQRVDFLTEEYQGRLGDYLNEPANVKRMFGVAPTKEGEGNSAATRAQLLEEWLSRLEERELLVHVLAAYEVRNLHLEYCPPVHLQQLKRALVSREELKRVEKILQQFPARNFSVKHIEESARGLRRSPREEAAQVALRFAEDLMRLRRDRRNYQHVVAWMERINLVRSERARELSRVNNSLYEFLLADEAKPTGDPVVSHVVIKADVRGSTKITKDLLARGLNPASHFSLHLHEPVKRLLERHGAAKVFIEGDAVILAIYETEHNRTSQRAVAKACVLAREILELTRAFNARAQASELPPLELGLGVAFQNAPPSLWMDGDSRIMISRALNLSDRLSSCSKTARRLFAKIALPFHVFLLQTMALQDASEEEGEELLIRYNLNGIELNEDGFAKLSEEISLASLEGTFTMPWGKERVQLFYGELPLGDGLEPIVVRRGLVREFLSGGKIGEPTARIYYEVCTHQKLIELAQKKASSLARH